jgi:hypothetical protein
MGFGHRMLASGVVSVCFISLVVLKARAMTRGSRNNSINLSVHDRLSTINHEDYDNSMIREHRFIFTID